VHGHREQAADGLDFFDRAGLQHHTIGLQALLFAEGEDGLRVAVLIDQATAQPITGVAALSEPSSISRHWPANTLADSSRLYSPAIARLTVLTIVEATLPSFSNCSAQ
jgi:hypothetical protein